MTLREITIGRSKNCDIYLDPRCQFASNMHATIYYDGTQLMYKDTSTNGTMINNVSVRHRAVPIRRGDIIMIAGKYQINWNQIDAFFPPTSAYQTPTGTLIQPGMAPAMGAAMPDPTGSTTMPQAGDANITNFSWAAFFLNWIWGVFNGCWWMILIWLGFLILAFIPFVNIISGIGSFILNICFGIYGRRWAWANRSWTSAQDFNSTQATWDKVAIILFCVCIALVLIGIIVFFAVAGGVLSSL